jgi:hypothetical protein
MTLSGQAGHLLLYVQGTLTEGEGSVQLTSKYRLTAFDITNINYLFSKFTYLHLPYEEVNRTEPSRSVSVPWCMQLSFLRPRVKSNSCSHPQSGPLLKDPTLRVALADSRQLA